MNQSSRGEKNRDQPALTTVQEKTWCRCTSALNPRSCLKGLKSFLKAKPNTFQKNIVTLLDLERKKNSIPKPLAQERFVSKSLRVDRRNTFPMVREGDMMIS